jgi:hypothetical protein
MCAKLEWTVAWILSLSSNVLCKGIQDTSRPKGQKRLRSKHVSLSQFIYINRLVCCSIHEHCAIIIDDSLMYRGILDSSGGTKTRFAMIDGSHVCRGVLDSSADTDTVGSLMCRGILDSSTNTDTSFATIDGLLMCRGILDPSGDTDTSIAACSCAEASWTPLLTLTLFLP